MVVLDFSPPGVRMMGSLSSKGDRTFKSVSNERKNLIEEEMMSMIGEKKMEKTMSIIHEEK